MLRSIPPIAISLCHATYLSLPIESLWRWNQSSPSAQLLIECETFGCQVRTSNTSMSPTTLPARYYTDPDLFRDELERYYCHDWICTGRVHRIPHPGDYFLREVAGESIIITRDENDSLRAFFNVCRHRGTRICASSEGHFAGRIRCGYHGWTYGLDGGLIGAPHTHDGFCREDYPESRSCRGLGRTHLH
jgi:nitrite reductase/ring-hydroxylating ferredoxin subunit